jgi:hypothetical protein
MWDIHIKVGGGCKEVKGTGWGRGRNPEWTVGDLCRMNNLIKDLCLWYPPCQPFTMGWLEGTVNTYKQPPVGPEQFLGEKEAEWC